MTLRIMCHGRHTLRIAREYGWLPGARYTNLRDLRGFRDIGLIDIDWKNYDFQRHLAAVEEVRPRITIARDITRASQLEGTLKQATELARWAEKVVIVPKDRRLGRSFASLVPERFLLGYSVPTRYGRTEIPLEWFGTRRVHLLGGRPDKQYELSKVLNVFSVDGNRITLDAQYGDYFVGDRFKPHPTGGYHACLRASLQAINRMWARDEPVQYRQAVPSDLISIKTLADHNKNELGFVLRPAIAASIETKSAYVAVVDRQVVGYVRFHHRRDYVTKVYEICVETARRRQGIGRGLLDCVSIQARIAGHWRVGLKCPENSIANGFYASLGFERIAVEPGKRRRLALWEIEP